MNNRIILLSLLCIAYPPSVQSAVYKCSNEEGAVVYQDMPCKAGQTSIKLADVPIRNLDPGNAGPSVFNQDPQPQPPSQFNGLVLGMTDTEVLNMRGWRRPGKITRSRANHAVREEWTYFSPVDGRRLLQFSNGKLTAINTEPAVSAPEIVAQITPQ